MPEVIDAPERIGIRDLQVAVDRVLDAFECGAARTAELTDAGETVARVTMLDADATEAARRAGIRAWFAGVSELARRIGAVWPPGLSAAEAVAQDRRDLGHD